MRRAQQQPEEVVLPLLAPVGPEKNVQLEQLTARVVARVLESCGESGWHLSSYTVTCLGMPINQQAGLLDELRGDAQVEVMHSRSGGGYEENPPEDDGFHEGLRKFAQEKAEEMGWQDVNDDWVQSCVDPYLESLKASEAQPPVAAVPPTP